MTPDLYPAGTGIRLFAIGLEMKVSAAHPSKADASKVCCIELFNGESYRQKRGLKAFGDAALGDSEQSAALFDLRDSPFAYSFACARCNIAFIGAISENRYSPGIVARYTDQCKALPGLRFCLLTLLGERGAEA